MGTRSSVPERSMSSRCYMFHTAEGTHADRSPYRYVRYSHEQNEDGRGGAFGSAARHFACGNVGCLIEWLDGGFEATPEQLAAQVLSCMPSDLREAYAELAET